MFEQLNPLNKCSQIDFQAVHAITQFALHVNESWKKKEEVVLNKREYLQLSWAWSHIYLYYSYAPLLRGALRTHTQCLFAPKICLV
jgi:hypothetical protein